MNPLISICIPTLNRLNYLKQCYSSISSSNYENIEILISLDRDRQTGNFDHEISVWLKYISILDKRIKIFFPQSCLGLSGNWNYLIEKANGLCCLILGDDDRILPNTISDLLIGINLGADISFSNHFLIDENGLKVSTSFFNTKLYSRHLLQDGFILFPQKYIWLNSIPISSSLIRTSLLKLISFNNSINTPEIVFFLEAEKKGSKFYFSTQYLVEYRIHSLSATSKGLTHAKLFEILRKISVDEMNFEYKVRFLRSISFSVFYEYVFSNNKKKALKMIFTDFYEFKFISSHIHIIHLFLLVIPFCVYKKFKIYAKPFF